VQNKDKKVANSNRDGWSRLPKLSLSSKDLTKRMRRVETVTVRHAHKFIIRRWSSVREVRMRIITWVITISVLIAATGIQLIWFQRSYMTSAQTGGGAYAEAVLGPVGTLDPIFASSSAEQSASDLMFSHILSYDTSGHLKNDLATSITISPNDLVYTIKIRPDAKWDDGVALTAKDIAFTVGLLQNPDVHSTISGWTGIQVAALDATTVQFTLPAPYAAFEYALTFPILPQHILGSIAPVDVQANNYGNDPIGSGPFAFSFTQVVDANSGKEIIHMTRNDTYYGGTAKLEQFQLNVYATRDDITHALATSEVNAAADLSITDLSSVNLKRYAAISNPIDSGVYAILNTTSPTLSDKTIRQALQIGTDTATIRSDLPVPQPALYLPFTTGQLTGDVPAAPVFDLPQANQLLQADGWLLQNGVRTKDGKTLSLSIVTIKNTVFERVLEVLSGQWRAMGIQINTQVVDPTDVTQDVYQNILKPRNYDVLLYQLDIGADPDVYAYWDSSQVTASNYSNYSNAISDDALSSARSRLEPDLRNAKYLTFAREWLQDVPAIGLYQPTAQYVYAKGIQAYDPSNTLVTPTDRFDDVLNWTVQTHTVYKTP
jgi:peptide/nickel transport system substrate-binding protein